MITRWQNLTRNKCPKCGGPLGFNTNDEMLFCEDILTCDFQISQYIFERRITQMNGKKVDYGRSIDNFAELQNIGSRPLLEEEPIGEGVLS